jgi:hypothetical protein
MSTAPHIPENIEALRAAYIASQEALIAERAGRAAEQAALASAENTIAHLKKLIARLQHDRYGASSERSRKLVDQLELQLAELTTAQSEAKTKAEINRLASTQSGLVAYLCRSDYSFRLPGVRRPGGFCPPKLNAFGAGYRSR